MSEHPKGYYRSAEYKRLVRARRKQETGQPIRAYRDLPASDDELMAEVIRRGRVLSEMMRTPLCMWPAEWTDD